MDTVTLLTDDFTRAGDGTNLYMVTTTDPREGILTPGLETRSTTYGRP